MLHNAGKSQRARWEYTDLEVDKDVFNLNVFSVVNLSRCIMPHFMERNSGTFALMSSTAGKVLLIKSRGEPDDSNAASGCAGWAAHQEFGVSVSPFHPRERLCPLHYCLSTQI